MGSLRKKLLVLAVVVSALSFLIVYYHLQQQGLSFGDITVEQAKSLIETRPGLIIADLRNRDEYKKERIEGAINLCLECSSRRISDVVNQSDEILLYCSNGEKSRTAMELLKENGFDRLYNMLGGIEAWIDAGYPVIKRVDIIQGDDLINPDLWLPWGNATIVDGKAYLNITEREETLSSYAGIQQGVYPHSWNRWGSIEEIAVNQSTENNTLFLRVLAKRSEFQFYDETKSIVNIGIMIWIQLDENYERPINGSKQLELDISLTGYVWTLSNASTSYNNGEPMLITWDTSSVGDGTLDEDYHYVVIPKEGQLMTEADTWYEIEIDAGWCVRKALGSWGIQQATIRSFTPFIEAECGSGSVMFEEVEFFTEERA